MSAKVDNTGTAHGGNNRTTNDTSSSSVDKFKKLMGEFPGQGGGRALGHQHAPGFIKNWGPVITPDPTANPVKKK